MTNTTEKQRQGIQSIEVGTRLLRALATHGRPMMLRDLAKNAGMPAAKAHRYLVSFMRMGLVEQDANTGRYDLGAFSLELGLASLSRLDPVRLGGPILEDLCEQIGETVALAMLGNHGATIVRWVEAGGPITVTLRTGTVLPLSRSATGRAFVAYCRLPFMKKLLERELRDAAAETGESVTAQIQTLEPIINEIRLHGISRATGSLTPGINGFSAPVFDHTGHMVAAVTSLGAIGHFDTDWNSPLAVAIKEAARALSLRLGHGETTPIQPGNVLGSISQ
ncbi:MAG: IclR family transcriptional regulator [Candidatus Accumulibacter sp.]|uniref:IclR family transcriptional regulator n=1 Tax=Accumulibacter sp. TaxID=2053492 RepID=UPI002879D0E5|nr:IclR family transcriptional regulator [Accumulibacter sp.]MDS4013445.1 IclR family transcriptional regulator [Accumulibacter sp.]